MDITTLPDGWLGKLHAMKKVYELSSGEWILFSDADVFIADGAVAKALLYSEVNKIDHLPVIPQFYTSNHFWTDVLLSITLRIISLGGLKNKMEDSNSPYVAGSDSFNLVPRSAFEKTPGFDWIKMEVIDDVMIGQMVKQTGGKNLVGISWYSSFKQLLEGSERSLFAGIGNYSATRLSLITISLVSRELSPHLFLFFDPLFKILGISLILLTFATSARVYQWMNRPIVHAFFLPLGMIMLFYILIRSAILGALRKGIYWRGTFYSVELLREGRRIKL